MLCLLDIERGYPDDSGLMNVFANGNGSSWGLPLILAAGIAMYVAAKALSDALLGGQKDSPGLLAIGHWLPIAVLAVTAAATNRPYIAVGLIYSTAVACLGLGAGSVVFLGPVLVSPAARKTWGLLVPAGLMAFLAGFRGTISLYNAAVLALQGLCVLMVWNDRTGELATISANASSPRPGRSVPLRVVQFVLALALSGVGAWLALHGVDRVAATSEYASAGLLTATLLSPILVLPLMGTGTELAHHNQAGIAVASQVGVALLNACALLPMVVVASYFGQWRGQHFAAVSFNAIPFPLAVWRVDVIMLIALGLYFLPMSMGRWTFTRMQGLGLMCGYVLYLGLTILIGRRV